MKRQGPPRAFARRGDVADLARHEGQMKGAPQAAIARQLQVPQGTVSRDLAAMPDPPCPPL